MMFMQRWLLLSLALLSCLPLMVAAQEPPSPAAQVARTDEGTHHHPHPRACVHIEGAAARLQCYDRVFGRKQTETETQSEPDTDNLFPFEPTEEGQAADMSGSLLDSRWELSQQSKLGIFNIRAYKPLYILPLFYSDNVNKTPSSPNPDRTVTSPLNIQPVEVKFQLSFKDKLWQNVFGRYGDLWFGYTQVSHWQFYNGATSRPFRETDYAPEVMMVFATDYPIFGWRSRLMSVGILHQSNGRSDPFSRSWNRVTFAVGLERNDWTLTLRPWVRIPQDKSDDDNPGISDYMGRGDLLLVHESDGNEYSLMLRHSLRGGDKNHGAMEFNWAFPIRNSLKGYLQVFNGYGESLIDYNHRALYVGLGVSLSTWY
jgi:phospholipase A1/A2